jgi:hypothetical protein
MAFIMRALSLLPGVLRRCRW